MEDELVIDLSQAEVRYAHEYQWRPGGPTIERENRKGKVRQRHFDYDKGKWTKWAPVPIGSREER